MHTTIERFAPPPAHRKSWREAYHRLHNRSVNRLTYLSMSDLLKYVLLVIFLVVVFAIVWILRDGISVRHSGSFSFRSNPRVGPTPAFYDA
jgi:hypothetical protein